MAKLKSTLPNMFLSLTIICIVSSAILAFVNTKTVEPISFSKKQKLENAVKLVVSGFDNSPLDESWKVAVAPDDSLIIYPAKKEGELIGVAIESNSMKGFGGEIKIIVGLSPEGKVLDYAVLQHAETPGLGDKMGDWFKADKNKQSIIGKDLSNGLLSVTKDGGDVDAITAATISSRAFLDAVNRAYAAYAEQEIDSASGASANTGASATH
ncbi:RnfABCDGE type electron transport complex subunit G [Viscerimonas tarda]